MEFATNGVDMDAEKGVRRAVVRLTVQAEMLEEMTRRLEAVFGPVLTARLSGKNCSKKADKTSELANDLNEIGDSFEESLSVIRTIVDSADL